MDICEKLYGTGQNHDFFGGKGCGFTAYEIAQQPDMWRKLSDMLAGNKDEILKFRKSLPKDVRVILTGAGSSGFAGRAVAGYSAEYGGILGEAIHTPDIVSSPRTIFGNCDRPVLLVSFARSGNSPESVGAVEYAREIVKDLYELAIVCDGTSKLAQAARSANKGLVLVMPEGTNDKGFAMTSSVSSMIFAGLAALNADKLDELVKEIRACADLVDKNGAAIAASAKACAEWDAERAWYLGSGALTAIAQEAALKMMELTNGAVVASFNNAPEFRHGPKTVISPKTLTIHLISDCPFTAKYDMDVLNELCGERDGNKIASLSAAKADGDWNCTYSGKGISVGMQCLLFVQILAMYKSINIGVNTDNPSPSGLVNRVVQGVTVYPYEKRT